MATMVDHLKQTGVDVSQPVGVIVGGLNPDGEWAPQYARLVRVLTEPPAEVENSGHVEEFDPEFDLCVTWPGSEELQVKIFTMTNDSILYAIDPGGLIIEDKEKWVIFGQSDFFLAKVRHLWAHTEGILLAD